MKFNKLVLFDWGNIVEAHTTGYNCYDAFDNLFKRCGCVFEGRIFTQLGKYKLSQIKDEEEFKIVFQEMKKDLNLKVSFDEFKKIYYEEFDNIDYYQDVVDFEHSLKDKCYIGILSNLFIYDKDRLNRQVNLSMYDYVFLSFELGMKKPNRDIFEYVLDNVEFDAKDILFIDDREDNVNIARELGINAMKATGLELDRIKSRVEEFLKVHD